MGFSLNNLVVQFQQLEEVLAADFQAWFREFRTRPVGTPVNEALNFKLVEQLQFHDILRQKIEHIRHFWEVWLAEQEEEEVLEEAGDILPEMIELVIALLRFTALEYEEVAGKIKNLMIRTGRQAEKLYPGLFAEQAQLLLKELEQMYLQLEVPEEEEGSSPESRLKKVWDSFSMQSERDVFSMLFTPEPGIDQDKEPDNPQGQVELF